MGKSYRIPIEVTFWNFVKKTSHCWIWIGGKTTSGYGHINSRKRNFSNQAHRVSWIIHNGVIPEGKWVLHNCKPLPDNRLCVNPKHLWIGDRSDNAIDAMKKGTASGENAGRAKLTNKQAKWCRAHFHNKYGEMSRMAKRFGVTRGAIWALIKKENWKHIRN